MSALSNVGMYLELTREMVLSDASSILNDTARRNYSLPRIMAARPEVDIRPGDKIIEELKLSMSGNFSEFTPGQRRSISSASVRVPSTYQWRFAENHRQLVQAQTTLNRGMDQATVIKNFAKQIRKDGEQDHVDGMETRVWGPTAATMETGAEVTDAKPFSIPTYITEQTAPVGLAGTGTLANVNFTTYPNWDNQRYGYDSTDPLGANGILNAFDVTEILVGYVPPTGKGSDAFSPDKRSNFFIWTNKDGIVLFKKACRAGNDRFQKGVSNPAIGKIEWGEIGVDHAAVLDDALLEQSSGTAYSNAAYTAGKPRFFWHNPDFLFPAFQQGHYMNETVVPGGAEFRDTEVIFWESMWQMVCTSRKRQAIVCPQASWVTNSN